MQSFTFDELNEKAKQAVRINYLGEILVSWPKVVEKEILQALDLIKGWRFTEHGERVA